MASFARALTLLLLTLGVDGDGHVNNTNDTEVYMYGGGDMPTPMPTASGVLPVTNFKISLGISEISDFDEAEFIKAIAELTGVNPEQVTLSEVKFEMSTSYEVKAAISLADAKAAIGGVMETINLAEDSYEVTVGNTRRLSQDGSRRLASHASTTTINGKVSIPVAQAALAEGAKTVLSNTAGVAVALGVDADKVTGGSVSIMVVATAAVQSTSSTPVVAPTAQAFLDKMKEIAPGKTFTIGTVEAIADPTAAPTKAPTEEEESGTPKLSGLFHVALAAAAGLAAVF